jgi:uncharacterized protein YyaL (SSP411 family)
MSQVLARLYSATAPARYRAGSRSTIAAFAGNLDRDSFQMATLLAARGRRESPARDEKVLADWNGLAIAALARAGAAFAEPEWVRAAVEAAEHVLRVNRDGSGDLVRASLDGTASAAVATTADVALLADGLFALALATGDVAWAVEGRALLDDALAGLAGDPLLAENGIATAPDQTDGDLPSGAAAVASASLTAWLLGAGDRYRDAAAQRVREHATPAVGQPFAHGSLLRVAAGLVDAPRQLVVVTDLPDGALASAARGADADAVAIVSPAQARAFADAGFELFEGKAGAGEQAFDCRSFVCRLPVSDPAELALPR